MSTFTWQTVADGGGWSRIPEPAWTGRRPCARCFHRPLRWRRLGRRGRTPRRHLGIEGRRLVGGRGFRAATHDIPRGLVFDGHRGFSPGSGVRPGTAICWATPGPMLAENGGSENHGGVCRNPGAAIPWRSTRRCDRPSRWDWPQGPHAGRYLVSTAQLVVGPRPAAAAPSLRRARL